MTFFCGGEPAVWLMRLSIVMGLPLLLYAASRVREFRWWQPVAESVFFVYGSHLIVLSFVERHIVCAMPLGDVTLSVAYILIPLLVIFLCVCASIAAHKLCPPLWSWLTGGRG